MSNTFDLGSYGAHIVLDSNNFESGIKKAEGSMNQFQGKTQSFASSIGTVAKTAVIGLGVAAVGASVAVGKVGLSFNAMQEQSQVAWTTLLGSGKAAEDMLKRINQFAARTPFETEDVDAMAKSLTNAGLKGDALFAELMKASDVSSAFALPAESAKEMVRQMSQVRMAGTAYTEDLNILADRGVPIYKAISKQLGVTVGDVKMMASKGKLSADVYLKAFDSIANGAKGASDAQSKTFNGMMSSLSDTFKMIAGQLNKPIFDFLKKGLTDLLPILSNVLNILKGGGGIGDIAKAFGISPNIVNFITNAFKGIKDTITGLFNFYMGVVKSLTSGEGNLGQSFKSIFNTIKSIALPILKDAIAFIKQTIGQLKKFWDENGAQIIQAVKNVWSIIAGIFKVVAPVILCIVKSLFGSIKGVISGALIVIMGIVKLFADLFTGRFGKIWGDIKQIFSGAIKAIWNFMKIGFIGVLLDGVIALGKKLVGLFKSMFSGITKVVVTVLTNIKETVAKKWQQVKEIFTNTNLYTIGKQVIEGLVKGLASVIGNISKTVKNIGKSVLDGFKKVFDIHSPSKETEKLGKNVGEGLHKGIESTKDKINKSAKDIKKKFDEAFKNANYKFDVGKINSSQYLTELRKIRNEYAKNSDQVRKVNLEIHNVQVGHAKQMSSIAKKSFNDAVKSINDKRALNKISADQELNILKTLAKKYKANSQERIQIEKEILKVQKEIAKKKEEMLKTAFEKEKQFIDDKKYYNQLSLVEEEKLYEKYIAKYKKGSEERAYYERELYRVKKEINDQLESVNEEYNSKIQETEQKMYQDQLAASEDYNDKVKEITQKRLDDEAKAKEDYEKKIEDINQKLIDDENKLTEEYTRAVEDRTKSLYSFAGLFDEIKKKDDVTGQGLLNNLQNQVNVFTKWQNNLSNLSGRGLNSDLLSELTDMGPKAADEIAALTSLSDDQLTQYVSLWQQKNEQAKTESVKELEGMRLETQNKIGQLRYTTAIELDKVRGEYDTAMTRINTETNIAMDKVKKDWIDKLAAIRTQATEELKKYQTEWNTKIAEIMKGTSDEFVKQNTTMNDIGKNLIGGIMSGLSAMTPELMSQAKAIADSISKTIKSALKIKSPSRVMMEIGGFISEGLALGVTDNMHLVEGASASLSSAFSGISISGSIANNKAVVRNNSQKQITPQTTQNIKQYHFHGMTVQADSPQDFLKGIDFLITSQQ